MKVVDVGAGSPIVVIPGVQGRWEWMRPAIDALARQARVVTFSLADEPSSGGRFEEASGFACYVEQVREALDIAGLMKASICGVSYGGLIAAAFAARYPERTTSLILVSPLPPSWKPDSRVAFYLKAPRLLSPLFCLGAVRLYPEIGAAAPGLLTGLVATARHGWNVVTHMFSPTRMARRVRLLDSLDLRAELVRVTIPTLIVTGDETLERVMPVRASHEYARIWPQARLATLDRTGHLGSITRPDAFADIVVPFVVASDPGRGATQQRERDRAGREPVAGTAPRSTGTPARSAGAAARSAGTAPRSAGTPARSARLQPSDMPAARRRIG